MGKHPEAVKGAAWQRPAWMVDAAWAAAIGMLLLAVYLANGRAIPTIDNLANRYVAVSILRERNMDLTEFTALMRGAHPPQSFHRIGESVYTHYPPGAAILAAPVYLVMRLAGWRFHGHDLQAMEKGAAAVLMAACGAMLFLVLRHHLGRRAAALLALAYGVGTINMVISSQSLWQHTAVQFSLLAYLLLVVPRPLDWWRAPLAGLAMGMIYVSRPTTAVLIVLLGLWTLWHQRRSWRAQLVVYTMALAVLAAQLAFNHRLFGHPLGYYYTFHTEKTSLGTSFSPWALLTMLASPGGGMLVYTPLLLLVVPAMAMVAWRRQRDAAATLAVMAAAGLAAYLLLYASFSGWWGGENVFWGPRFLSDVLPLGFLALVPLVPWIARRRRAIAAAVLLGLWGVALNGAGLMLYHGIYGQSVELDRRHEKLLWRADQSPWWFAIRRGDIRRPAPAQVPETGPNGLVKLDSSNGSLRAHLGAGFQKPEQWGVWSGMPWVRVYLRSAAAPANLLLRCYPRGPAVVTIHLNGQRLARHEVEDQPFHIKAWLVSVPPGLWRTEGLNELRVESTLRRYQIPDSQDQRSLFVGMQSVLLGEPE